MVFSFEYVKGCFKAISSNVKLFQAGLKKIWESIVLQLGIILPPQKGQNQFASTYLNDIRMFY